MFYKKITIITNEIKKLHMLTTIINIKTENLIIKTLSEDQIQIY